MITSRLFPALLGCLLVLLVAAAPAQERFARLFDLDGAIGPASADFVVRGLASAAEDGASFAILRLDTPGGLDAAMRDIIQAILDSPIPVVTWVAPEGARAASAGTYILYASHVAAMAPATTLGAATPVSLLGGSDEADGGAGEGGAMARKAVNDARAYIRALAERHGRNAEWAERAVTEAATLSADEALEENVVDLIASDLDALLLLLQGRQIETGGSPVVLDTTGLRVEVAEPGWRSNFLRVLTDPNLILILGMIGLYGLIIEFYNPGIGLAGVTGVICLLLAGYGLQLLPLNYAGLGLVLLGFGLMLAEAFVPSFGLLGLGGVVAFTMGAVLLFESDLDMFRASLPFVAALALFSALVTAWTLRQFLRVRRQPVVTGGEELLGAQGECLEDFEHGAGMVRLRGELWEAESALPLRKGEAVEVVGRQGLRLQVRPLRDSALAGARGRP